MMIPVTLFLYLAVDAPAQTLMRALFKKCKLKVLPHFKVHLTLLIYLARVEDRKIDESVYVKEMEHPRQYRVEGDEEILVQKLEEIKSSN
jgi:hypothetical protein